MVSKIPVLATKKWLNRVRPSLKAALASISLLAMAPGGATLETHATAPIQGFADLHLHLGAHLAFGGDWIWGSPAEPLKKCSAHAHVPSLVRPPETAIRHGRPGEEWPHFKDVAHQQIHEDALRAAHQRGLQLIVAPAVTNEWLCRLLNARYNRQTSCEDMEWALRQLHFMNRFAQERRDWMEVALSPAHARAIIAERKLAVVLALEVSHLLPSKRGPLRAQLDELESLGVRSFPSRNPLGLSEAAYRLVDELVARKILLDVAHLSERSLRDVFQHVSRNYPSYPLFYSHAKFAATLAPSERKRQGEFILTRDGEDYLRMTGGMVGLRTAPERALGGDFCPGSTSSFAQHLLYARTQARLPTAFGTDLNGFTAQIGPRLGPERCPALSRKKRGVPPSGLPETSFARSGLASIAELPAPYEDLAALEAPHREALLEGAEQFIQMWERASRSSPKDEPH